MGILQARILEWVAMPSSGDLPNPGIKPRSPALQADSSPSKPTTYVKTYWLVKFKYVQFIVCQLYFRKALIKILKENDSCETREKKKQNSFLFFFFYPREVQFSSVTQSLSDCLWPHGLQHTRLPCPSSIPGACSNSCLSSRWCHPTI